LREYLLELKPEARALLASELERALLRGRGAARRIRDPGATAQNGAPRGPQAAAHR
jgi:hypothetical protein